MPYLSSMRFFVVIMIFLVPLSGFSQARRARTLIEKQKLSEARELLQKALHKDSLAAAEKYVLAGLYFNPAFTGYNIDSAYHYILAATSAWDFTEAKEQETLAGRGFNPEAFNRLKAEIEQAGFDRAVQRGTEKDYLDFIAEFNTSGLVDSAIVLRNAEAFKTARTVNTWQAYEKFFVTYPEAKQVPEARKRYEKLLFLDQTADGKLSSYQSLLQAYPETWHRQEAEQQIYNIITGKNTPRACADFYTAYPQSFLATRALIRHYNLLNEEIKQEFMDKNLLSQEVIDSLLLIERLKKQLVLPVIHNGHYALINQQGQGLIGGFNNLSRQDKCGKGVPGLALASLPAKNILIALDSSVLDSGRLVSITSQPKGIIKVTADRGVYFLTESGIRDNPHYFHRAAMAGSFIAYQEKGRWGLESITGIALLPAVYDTIFSFNRHLVLNKGNQWGVFPESTFYPLLDHDSVSLALPYDMVSVESPEYALLAKGEQVALMNRTGDIIVPLAEQTIELVAGGYFIDRADSILDTRVGNHWYRDIYQNEYWIIGEKKDTVEVYYQSSLILKADEARTLGSSAAIISWGDSTFCYFNDSTRLYIAPKDKIMPVSTMDQNSRQRHYFYAAATPGKDAVYNHQGEQVPTGKFDKLIDLGGHYLLSKIKRTYRLLSDSGRVLLKNIDAAVSLPNGYVSYLADGKFGLFNLANNTHIKPRYDRPFATYNDSLFVVVKDNKQGLVNRSDSVVVPLAYNEIRYLSDTIAVLQNNFRWLFQDLKNSSLLVDNVSDYWPVQTSNRVYYKLFKGIGYGIWSPASGMILPPTFSEIKVQVRNEQIVFMAEKWVEEADLVVMLYYNGSGALVRKEVLSTAEYEDLACPQEDQEE